MTVKIPGTAVAAKAPDNEDIEAPTVALLRGLSLLPSAKDTEDKPNAFTQAFTGPPDSEAVIEAGATAASKWWAAGLAGGATAVAARIGAIWTASARTATGISRSPS